MSEEGCGICFSCQVCVECEVFGPMPRRRQPPIMAPPQPPVIAPPQPQPMQPPSMPWPQQPPTQIPKEELEKTIREIVMQILIELGLVKEKKEGKTVA